MAWVRMAMAIGSMSALACGPSASSFSAPTTTSAGTSEPGLPATVESGVSHDEGVEVSTSPTTTTTDETTDDGIPPWKLDAMHECLGVCIVCDLWAQDCPRGQKCMATDLDGDGIWDSPECVDLARDPGAPGDPCSVESAPFGGDDCDVGEMCWNVDADTNEGTCVVFCSGSEANPLCPDGDVCLMAYSHARGTLQLIVNCLPPCDPLAPHCDPGFACVASQNASPPDTFACVPESLVADHSSYADACDEILGCGTGLLCTDASDVPGCVGNCCTALCDPLAANTCPDADAGQICRAHHGSLVLGHCGVP